MVAPSIRGSFHYPLSALTPEQVDQFKEALTYVSPYPDDTGKYKTIEMYDEDENYLKLPNEWVRANFPNIYDLAEDARVAAGTLVAEKLPDPYHPSVRDPAAQAEFINNMLTTVQQEGRALCSAPTGSGKTVVSLYVAAKLGLRTLVLVHNETLRDQWIAQAEDKLGIPRERIGILQQNKCEIEGKDIVIGMLQTLVSRTYPESVYESFGLVIVDECHKISTEYFSSVVYKFHSKYLIALSATIERKDGSDVVLYNYVGPIRVSARTKIMPLRVHVRKYYAKRKLWGKDERERMAAIARDRDRNEMMANDIFQLYKSGRNIVAVSNSVKHLELIMDMCRDLGLPEYDMGLLSANRSKYDAQNWNRIGMRKSTKEENDAAKETRVCFMVDAFKEGIDVPRWDFLYELMPFWNANQRCGRVRRFVPNKLYPKAITIRDMKCEFSEKMWLARRADYEACGAEVV